MLRVYIVFILSVLAAIVMAYWISYLSHAYVLAKTDTTDVGKALAATYKYQLGIWSGLLFVDLCWIAWQIYFRKERKERNLLNNIKYEDKMVRRLLNKKVETEQKLTRAKSAYASYCSKLFNDQQIKGTSPLLNKPVDCSGNW